MRSKRVTNLQPTIASGALQQCSRAALRLAAMVRIGYPRTVPQVLLALALALLRFWDIGQCTRSCRVANGFGGTRYASVSA